MKQTKIAICLALMMALLLVGCAGATFTTTSVGNKSTIEVNNAEDGATAEAGPFSVGKGKTAYVESALEKGKLQIDFAEATVFKHDDMSDDVIIGDVKASVTVGAGEQVEVPLERGDYVLQLTAVGNTGGKVTVNIK